MVSFSCENCNETVKKPKLAQHQSRCYGAYFTCIDCSTTFYNNEHTKHTSCISEAEKYEKGLYKGKKKAPPPQQQPKPEEKKIEEKKPEAVKEKKIKDNSVSLYKILKENKKSKKHQSNLLKSLKVTKLDDGSLSLTYEK
ncbi:hypothetical protein CANARDRAFT_196084 [[Candida] arabinofermentans NRRL YB-2248]|uniref:Zinc finger C2H2 LYAR-type domain-containing protein n=1 Tax=[Candida] arabinofermentans NRRL YB-2248 TaxID=983967 RepID=A0A1E4T4Y7_9ASCO|nr:hypothetical protein CANARDRAFT_196084 [[Candida] arabinofermentans NRRL YB-2248]